MRWLPLGANGTTQSDRDVLLRLVDAVRNGGDLSKLQGELDDLSGTAKDIAVRIQAAPEDIDEITAGLSRANVVAGKL